MSLNLLSLPALLYFFYFLMKQCQDGLTGNKLPGCHRLGLVALNESWVNYLVSTHPSKGFCSIQNFLLHSFTLWFIMFTEIRCYIQKLAMKTCTVFSILYNSFSVLCFGLLTKNYVSSFIHPISSGLRFHHCKISELLYFCSGSTRSLRSSN